MLEEKRIYMQPEDFLSIFTLKFQKGDITAWSMEINFIYLKIDVGCCKMKIFFLMLLFCITDDIFETQTRFVLKYLNKINPICEKVGMLYCFGCLRHCYYFIEKKFLMRSLFYFHNIMDIFYSLTFFYKSFVNIIK